MIRELKRGEVKYISGAKAVYSAGGSDDLESNRAAGKEFEKKSPFRSQINRWMDIMMGHRLDAILAGIIPSYEDDSTTKTEDVYPHNTASKKIAAFLASMNFQYKQPKEG